MGFFARHGSMYIQETQIRRIQGNNIVFLRWLFAFFHSEIPTGDSHNRGNVVATNLEIGMAGEKAVVDYLRDAKGFSNIIWDTTQSGASDIEAVGSKVRLLIQVKTSVHPDKPVQLSSEELSAIISRASAKVAQAWEARVVLDRNLKPKGDVEWRRLS